MKACKDCVHYRWEVICLFDPTLARCAHPKLTRTDRVTGKQKLSFAEVDREFESRCGAEAKHFEAKGKS